jgi:hypothetical protein
LTLGTRKVWLDMDRCYRGQDADRGAAVAANAAEMLVDPQDTVQYRSVFAHAAPVKLENDKGG